MDMYDILLAKKLSGGGGGVTVEELNVTENGDYSEAGIAYSPVHVNVSGGQAIGKYDLLGSFDFGDMDYSGESAEYVGEYDVTNVNSYDAVRVVIRRSEAPTDAWYFISCVQDFALVTNNYVYVAGATEQTPRMYYISTAATSAKTMTSSSKYGIYVNSVQIASGNPNNGKMTLAVYRLYYSTYGMINGHYSMNVYGLKIFDRSNMSVVM